MKPWWQWTYLVPRSWFWGPFSTERNKGSLGEGVDFMEGCGEWKGSLDYLAAPERLELLNEDGDTSQEETEASLEVLSLAKVGITGASG